MLKIDLEREREKRKRRIATILSVFIPGLGQFIRKRIASGLFFFLITFFFVWLVSQIWRINYGLIGLVIGGFIFYLINILDAYKGPTRYTAPCEESCPAGINIPLYIALIREGRFDDALDVILDRMPFPSVCGRVCHHPCESICSAREKGGAISIELLKRAASDFGTPSAFIPTPEKLKRKDQVAIIGAGPAGLSSAYFLSRKGYSVTVFDKNIKPGGMLINMIPSYRLSEDAAQTDIEKILSLGVTIKTGVTIGKDITFDELKTKYNAILIATGAQNEKKLNIKGADNEGIIYGIPFLKDAKRGKSNVSGKRVNIIGGGNVAIDCARSSIRLGAKSVELVCLEKRDLTSPDRMPAHRWEIEQAEKEGVKIYDSWGVKEALAENKRITGIELVRCISVYEGKERKFNPKFDNSTTKRMDTDMIIIATGQEADFSFLPTPIKERIVRNNTIFVDNTTMSTVIPGIFAAGDTIPGQKSVVDAVAMGRKAARGIDWYLRGAGRLKRVFERFIEFDYQPNYKIPKKRPTSGKRTEENILPKKTAVASFLEVELGFTKELAQKEAARCLQCNKKQ